MDCGGFDIPTEFSVSDDVYSSPAFQFYPNDFLGDTQDLSAVEIGAYIRLLCVAWKEGGIPNDMRALARISRLPVDEMKDVWDTALSRFWKTHGSDMFVNGRMEEVRAEALGKSRQAKAAANKRWESERTPDAEQPESEPDADALPAQSECNTDAERTECGRNAEAHSGRNALLTPNSVLLDTDSLRSSALKLRSWPRDNDGLRTLAKFFMAAFGNIRKAEKAEEHFPDYLEALAIFRSRGVSIESAWQCCAEALEANGGKPLFKARIKKAISFLPARAAPQQRPGLRVVSSADLENAI